MISMINFEDFKTHYILGGAARNLRWRLSTSSSTGMLRSPQRCPLWVEAIFTHTSLLPEALTPSNRLAIRESLQNQRKRQSDTEKEWHWERERDFLLVRKKLTFKKYSCWNHEIYLHREMSHLNLVFFHQEL